MSETSDDLGDPFVPAEAYDQQYFLHGCMGSGRWRESDGREIDPMYAGVMTRIGLQRGDRFLDIGCGRGELVRVAAEQGASRAVGIDYSAAAVELAQRTLAELDGELPIEVLQADARRLPFEDGSFDLLTALDVVEHLTPDELAQALLEARRVLAPGGTLFVHTAPNRLIYDVTYRLQRASRPSRWRSWPADPRNDGEREMHVNEQRMGSLRRAVKQAGFELRESWFGEWVYTDYVPDEGARRTYQRLARIPGLRRLAIMDLFVVGRKPRSR